MKNTLKLSLAMMASVALIGCATKPNAQTTANTANAGAGANTSGVGANAQLTPQQLLQQTLASLPNKVYFGFDQYNLTPDAITVLQQNAAVLLKNPQVNVMLAGNADPRPLVGGQEYNYHLGMKRAKAVYDYFSSQGVPASQMCMVSYGDLRPAASPAQFGGDAEKAYALDRRTEINYNQTCNGAGVAN